MSAYVVSNFIIYCIINAFTPGPGNILALNTTNVYGWLKGKPLFFGIFVGYFVVQVICGLFVFFIGCCVSRTITNYKIYWHSIYTMACF